MQRLQISSKCPRLGPDNFGVFATSSPRSEVLARHSKAFTVIIARSMDMVQLRDAMRRPPSGLRISIPHFLPLRHHARPTWQRDISLDRAKTGVRIDVG